MSRPAASRSSASRRWEMRRDDEGVLHRVVHYDGMDGFVVRWTASCTGCFESGEYGSLEAFYPWDEKAKCRIGAGCSECGHTGKVRQEHWEPFDSATWYARELRRDARRERWLRWLRVKQQAHHFPRLERRMNGAQICTL